MLVLHSGEARDTQVNFCTVCQARTIGLHVSEVQWCRQGTTERRPISRRGSRQGPEYQWYLARLSGPRSVGILTWGWVSRVALDRRGHPRREFSALGAPSGTPCQHMASCSDRHGYLQLALLWYVDRGLVPVFPPLECRVLLAIPERLDGGPLVEALVAYMGRVVQGAARGFALCDLRHGPKGKERRITRLVDCTDGDNDKNDWVPTFVQVLDNDVEGSSWGGLVKEEE